MAPLSLELMVPCSDSLYHTVFRDSPRDRHLLVYKIENRYSLKARDKTIFGDLTSQNDVPNSSRTYGPAESLWHSYRKNTSEMDRPECSATTAGYFANHCDAK
ncbi:Hypothetical predicted protein [Pelobates cultripes]|uniref:Uncharacterized protein n=1 Tax=Pelobates cultripes TaxID=61616 RepID=A0AAD1SEJ4_PELCU|nr:Hypothetical predicted protein [Pelobates cultripes]